MPGPERARPARRPGRAGAGRPAPARAGRPGGPQPDPGGPETTTAGSPRTRAPACDFLDTFDLGVLFVGLAVFAAVGALSHQHERAFSASLIYLGLGAGAAVVIAALDVSWIDPVDDAELIEHLAEAALVIALFSAGLKLDRPLRPRDWSTVARLLRSRCR